MAAGRSMLRLRASMLRGAPRYALLLGAAATAAVFLAAALVSHASTCTLAAPSAAVPQGSLQGVVSDPPLPWPFSSAA